MIYNQSYCDLLGDELTLHLQLVKMVMTSILRTENSLWKCQIDWEKLDNVLDRPITLVVRASCLIHSKKNDIEVF